MTESRGRCASVGDFAPVRQKPVFTRVGQDDEENVRKKLGAVLPAMELLEPGDAVPQGLPGAAPFHRKATVFRRAGRAGRNPPEATR